MCVDVVDGDLNSVMKLIHALAAHYKPHSVQKHGGTKRGVSPAPHKSKSKEGTKEETSCIRLSSRSRKRLPVEGKESSGCLPFRRFSSLESERLACGGGEVDGASSTGSPPPSEDFSRLRHATSGLSLNIPPPERHPKVFAERPARSLRESAISLNDFRVEVNPFHWDPDDGVKNLTDDLRKAKQQLLLLQDLLLRGHHSSKQSIESRTVDRSRPSTRTNSDTEDLAPKQQESENVIHRLKDGGTATCHATKTSPNAEKENGLTQWPEKDVEIKKLKEELAKQIEELAEERSQHEEAVKNLAAANRSKSQLTARLAEQERKLSRYEQGHSLPVTSKTQQREELQVVRDALSSLRRRFASNDPHQHTLDTIEQGISTLLERVSTLEAAKCSPISVPVDEDISPTFRRLNFDSTGDPRRYPITLHSFPLHRLDGGPVTDLDSCTKVLYYTEKSVTPFLSMVPKRIGDITLRDFKISFDRPGQYRYHFKTLDPEFGMVKEEVLHDDDLVPGWDGKIIAWIEDDNE